MAEIFGITAAAIQVLGVTITLVQQVRKAQDSINKSSQTLENIPKQLNALVTTLSDVRDQERLQIPSIGEQVQAINELVEELRDFVSQVKADQERPKIGRFVHALKSGDESDIKLAAIYGRIDRAESVLILRIFVAQTTLMGNLQERVNSDSSILHQTNENVKQLIGQGPTLAGPHEGTNGRIQVNNSTEKACLDGLFLTDPVEDRLKIIGKNGDRVQDTCQWIIANKKYVSWVESSSQLLWLSGGPGKGKTTLSVSLTQHLDEIVMKAPGAILAYYFFDNKDKKRNTAVTLLRGLMFQVLRQRPELMKHILPKFQIWKDSLFQDSSFETLWKIFEMMVQDPVATMYCVVDGLDECDEFSLPILAKKLRTLFSAGCVESGGPKFIVVSRKFPDCIPNELSGFSHMDLDSDLDREVRSDVERFISVRVDELCQQREYTESLHRSVKTALLRGAEGRFLWPWFMIQELRKKSRVEVEDTLNCLPTGLDEVYARMLLQIPDDRRVIAALILRWTAMAVRPLTLTELATAIGTKPSSFDLSNDDVMRDQVAFCGHLLMIKGNEVCLVHQSTKDYLLRKDRDPNERLEFFRVKSEEANSEIAKTLFGHIQYAKRDDIVQVREMYQSSGPNAQSSQCFPLLAYSVIHWPLHARCSSNSIESIFDLSLPFFAKGSSIRTAWLNVYWSVEVNEDVPGSFSLLHLASYFGVLPLARILLKTFKKPFRNPVFKKDTKGRTPLSYSAANGHENTTTLLLKQGAEVDAKDHNGETALIWAARNGHTEIVELLLGKGANIAAKDRHEGTALVWAATNGHKDIVRVLLKHGDNVNARDAFGETALIWSSENGHEAVVQQLLDRGADSYIEDRYHETAIVWAAKNGHQAVVQRLLEKGANVNERDRRAGTILGQAAENGHKAIVRILLEKGAAIDVKARFGRTPLVRAAMNGHLDVSRLLIEHGANVNAKVAIGGTALQLAAGNGHESVVRLLLMNRVDLVVTDKDGWTALHWAAWKGHEDVARLLIENGVNAAAMAEDGRRALHLAARYGHLSIVKLLLIADNLISKSITVSK